MFSLLIFLIILSIMILVHEYGHFAQARRLGIRVEKFSLGFGPKLLNYKRGDTEYTLCLFAFGGYVKLAGDSREDCKGESYEFLGRKPLERAKVIFAGPALNYLLAFVCFWLVNLIGYPNLTTRVGEVMAGYPAESAGILKDDLIISIEGKSVQYWNQLQEIIYKNKASFVELELLRNGEKVKLAVKLAQKEVKNILGSKQRISLLGIRPKGETVIVRHNVFAGFILAADNLWNLTVLTVSAFGKMLTGGLSFKENVTGPLGMFYVTDQAVKIGFNAVLHLMAVLSASLCIFNLLPFPILDGGHLFFLGLEKLRGRHLSEKVEEKISQVGFGFIISLAVFVFLNDLVKFGLWQKAVDVLKQFKP